MARLAIDLDALPALGPEALARLDAMTDAEIRPRPYRTRTIRP
jgi:hypothetical protein